MDDEDHAPETAAVKAWLASLLADSGLSKAALARELKVEPKTIYNAFGGSSKLPRGLTFYRLLRELDALRDPPDAGMSLSGRLARLEGELAATRKLVAEALGLQDRERELEAELQRLQGHLPETSPGKTRV